MLNFDGNWKYACSENVEAPKEFVRCEFLSFMAGFKFLLLNATFYGTFSWFCCFEQETFWRIIYAELLKNYVSELEPTAGPCLKPQILFVL